MVHNIQGFDPDAITTSAIHHYCERCGDRFQIGVRIEDVGDMLWWGTKCRSCGTPAPLSL